MCSDVLTIFHAHLQNIPIHQLERSNLIVQIKHTHQISVLVRLHIQHEAPIEIRRVLILTSDTGIRICYRVSVLIQYLYPEALPIVFPAFL